jgi:hypothetical protein
MSREAWLNGWHRNGTHSVLVGSQICCAGCGLDKGTATVVIPDGFVWPERDPDWPFEVEDCPVHHRPEELVQRFNARLDPKRLPK